MLYNLYIPTNLYMSCNDDSDVDRYVTTVNDTIHKVLEENMLIPSNTLIKDSSMDKSKYLHVTMTPYYIECDKTIYAKLKLLL